ncbi:MAG: hypothetical protein Q7T20_02765 [Saprospiraceae bacterium]|nr:hypothetical protein [Saprospiraceae bacterium]
MSKFIPSSLIAYWLCAVLLIAASVVYYPKWEKPNAEATISWDVSGYYLYLPGALIYKDLKHLKWWEAIHAKYHPGPGMGQAFQHPSGNWVLKYPMGQALQFLPWFATAHLLAEPLGYPADGFSRPYQAAISWGSLLVALLGLWYFRKVLKEYFSDQIVSIVLICVVFGSNYLEYASITGAMTHNWLFTLYSLMIFSTIQFYRRPSFGWAALIGLLVGWATITRPTEIIAGIIPVFWGINSWSTMKARFSFLVNSFPKITLSAICGGALIFLQLAYWKYASGEWIVYSYQDQTFSWFPPHIEDVLWSARAGWLVYSPMMLFAVIGIFMLRKRLPEVFPTVFCFSMIALYITSAWDIWWYGGSLGQRAMVQAYPLWGFGLGAFWVWVSGRSWRKWVFVPLAGICIYLNLWWSHQAHLGGLFVGEQMTRAYMLKVLGRFDVDRDNLKLLDTREEFKGGERRNVREILAQNFEIDTTGIASAEAPISGTKSMIIKEFSPEFELPVKSGEKGWLRASCTFRSDPKEWETWRMTQFIVRFSMGGKIVKERAIRLQRHVDGNEPKAVFFDTRLPDQSFDHVLIYFWNPGSNTILLIDDLKVELFE